MTWMVIAGVLLGVVSRVEEVEPFALGISTDSTWLAAAFAAGALRGTVAGAVAMTAANVAYYVYIDATEAAGVDYLSTTVGRWLLLGLAGAAVFGFLGHHWQHRLAWLPLLAIAVADWRHASWLP